MKNDLDRFILAKLEENGMTPNQPADKRTLIRRVYYDLDRPAADAGGSAGVSRRTNRPMRSRRSWTGCWPRRTTANAGAGIGSTSRVIPTPRAIDRRRESSIYPYAWTYRDYVIRAFNEDKPYDRFIIEQLAADRLNPGTNRDALAALGFLTLGDHFNGNMNDIINDRIDVVTKAFLGLTVSCARCHDHKFDPIPQADYYSLHGIFASSLEPMPKPEISDPNGNPNYADYQVKRNEMNQRIQDARTQNMSAVFGDYKRLAGVYLYAVQMSANDADAYVKKSGGDPALLKNWRQVAQRGGRQAEAVFGVWNALARIPPAKFDQQARRLIQNIGTDDRTRQWNPYVVAGLPQLAARTLAEAATIYGNLFARNDTAWQTTLSVLLSDAVLRQLAEPRTQSFPAPARTKRPAGTRASRRASPGAVAGGQSGPEGLAHFHPRPGRELRVMSFRAGFWEFCRDRAVPHFTTAAAGSNWRSPSRTRTIL